MAKFEVKISVDDDVEKLMEFQKEFIESVIMAFRNVGNVEKVEIILNNRTMTAYAVIGKNYLKHWEVESIYKHLSIYAFEISFENGKFEILAGDY